MDNFSTASMTKAEKLFWPRIQQTVQQLPSQQEGEILHEYTL